MPKTETTSLYHKGDWVSFMQGGKIVIGQIEYCREHETLTAKYDEFYTTVGVVSRESILEVRRG
jgi:hypothetical protein